MKLTITIPKKINDIVRTKTDNNPLRIHKDDKTIDGKKYDGKGRELLKKAINQD